jgi:excisionase family DNA binding protein
MMDKTYLTIKQVAEITGYSKGTLYNFVNRKEIPYHKNPKSRSIRFMKGEILGWMESRFRRVAPVDEKVLNLMGSIQR